MRLFTYKMTHDTGFAPNPFHGLLTLATCKPGIRKTKKINDWIAGFTSSKINNKDVEAGKLIYLMKLTEIIPISKYWSDPRFKSKIPQRTSNEMNAGDNIYKPLRGNAESSDDFSQIPNKYHYDTKNNKENHQKKDHDLAGKNVLISDCFYYLGSKAINISDKFKIKIPPGPSAYGVATDIKEAEDFIKYIQMHYKRGLIGYPHDWKVELNPKNNQRKCK